MPPLSDYGFGQSDNGEKARRYCTSFKLDSFGQFVSDMSKKPSVAA
jgi:hypothetical protein